jgi:hypothetical protein
VTQEDAQAILDKLFGDDDEEEEEEEKQADL